ncbi:MAG: hypothetical protein KDD61_17615, partial [Bdellovibrionales bacterium]|nr:hypothetical protein [Bdellovibrionales bacterium]
MKNEPQDASSSLYHDQLVILGLEANSGELTARQTTERERIRTIDLPPLNFPVRSSLQWRDWIKNPMFFLKFWAPVVVLSVALVVGLPFLSPKDRLQFKGGQKVDLFWEREGQIHPLKEGASLLVGDRVSATIISTEKSLAYWFVTDDQFKILTPLSEVRESRLELEPGVLGQFQSSVTLVDP